MNREYLRQFVLVGGTALALQIGHRKSIDLDLFTTQEFNTQELSSLLLEQYDLKPIVQTPQALICVINGVKVDFIRFKYPFIRPTLFEDGIRLLEIEDIAPMKLDAITGRGGKKDFYDLFFLLNLFSLDQIFSLYQEKYPHQTIFHVVRSMTYFADAENDPDPYVFDTTLTWANVKNFIIEKIRKL